MEKFVVIPSFPDYLVSQYGRVKTRSRKVRYVHSVTRKEHFRNTEERFLKVQFNSNTGYKFHQLYKGGKMYNKPIHHLVADAFIIKIDGKNYINHIDGNKHNNCVENLEWCTNEYNHEHATLTGLKPRGSRVGTSKLNENTVKAIKFFIQEGYSHSTLAKVFSVSRPNISLISSGKSWKHVNCPTP